MGNKVCNIADICGEKNISLDNVDTQNNQNENNHNNTSILHINKLNELIVDNNSGKNSDMNYIDSYNAYNNFYFLLSKITFLQKNIKLFLKRKQKQNNYDSINQSNFLFQNSLFKHSNSLSPQQIYNNFYTSTEVGRNVKITDENESLLLNNMNVSLLNQSRASKKIVNVTLVSYYSNNVSMRSEKGINNSEIKGYFLKKNKKYKFKGTIRDNKKVGFGKVTWDDKSILYANFIDSKANGICRYIDRKGTEFYGIYDNNRPKGYGYFIKGKVTYEGTWENNNLTGIGVELWKDETYYQGEFVKSVKKGIGLYRWPDGTIYQGEWSNNQMKGLGVIIYPDERMYQGEVTNGVMNGLGEFIWGNNKKYIGYYKDNKKHGFGIFFESIVPLVAFIGFWDIGKMNGLGIKINQDNISYGLWKEGKREMYFQGGWMMKSYLKGEYLQYEKLFLMTEKHLLKFIGNICN